MAVYPGLTGANSIGTLLRMIREQKSEGPMVSPDTEPNAPMREMVDQPYYGPESPGTNRVVSLRPEQPQPGELGEASATPMRSRVGPIGIGGGGEMMTAEAMGNPAAPAAPRPVPTVQPQGPAQQSSGPGPSQGQPQSQGQVLGMSDVSSPTAVPTDRSLAMNLIKRTSDPNWGKEELQQLQGMKTVTPSQEPNRGVDTSVINKVRSVLGKAPITPTPTQTPAPKQQNKYATVITINGRQMRYDPASNTYKRI